MKWYTHILWASLAYSLAAPPDVSVALAAAATVLTDALGHGGLRRAPHHDALALFAHTAVALIYTQTWQTALAGLLAGLLHVALDKISPGRLAVSNIYNLPFALAGAALWTLRLSLPS